jgi:hypothetical protein
MPRCGNLISNCWIEWVGEGDPDGNEGKRCGVLVVVRLDGAEKVHRENTVDHAHREGAFR